MSLPEMPKEDLRFKAWGSSAQLPNHAGREKALRATVEWARSVGSDAPAAEFEGTFEDGEIVVRGLTPRADDTIRKIKTGVFGSTHGH